MILKDEGYLVANNIYYADLDEGKGRELDLRELRYYLIVNEGDKS